MANNLLQLQKMLAELGLSEKEADLYLAAFTLGPSRITELATRARLRRTTAYSVIETLKKKGLMVEHIRGFKKTYSASSPEMLEVLHASKLNLLRQTLPLFETLKSQQAGVKSVVFLEGKEAVKSIYEELLSATKPKDYYYALTDVEKWRDLDPAYCDDFVRRRVKKNLKLHLLFTESVEAQNRRQLAPKLNEQVKFLPTGISLSANLVITPKRLVIHQTSSPVLAVSLENPTFIEIHRVMFEMLWESIKD